MRVTTLVFAGSGRMPVVLAPLLLLWLLTGCGGQQGGAPVEDDPRVLSRAIIHRSGIDRQLVFFVDLTNQALGPFLKIPESRLPAQKREQMAGILREAYRPARIQEGLESYLASHGEASHMRAVLKFLDSPLGRRITAMELEAATPEARERHHRFLQNLKSNPPDRERVALMKRLEQAIGAAEGGVVQITIVFAGVVLANRYHEQKAVVVREADLDHLIRSMKRNFAPTIESAMPLSMVHSYRKATGADIEGYIAFYQSDGGRWYRDIMIRAFGVVLRDLALEANRKILAL